MSYTRVIPRDLFNEANLLKCIGKLILLIDDGKIDLEYSYDEDALFEIRLYPFQNLNGIITEYSKHNGVIEMLQCVIDGLNDLTNDSNENDYVLIIMTRLESIISEFEEEFRKDTRRVSFPARNHT